jgi:hypothetical protein
VIVDFTVKTEHIVTAPIVLALKGLGYRNVKEYRSGFTLKDINGQSGKPSTLKRPCISPQCLNGDSSFNPPVFDCASFQNRN